MLTNNFRMLIADESGATAIEYGLIAALVSVAAISALGALGTSLSSIFTTVCESLGSAVEAADGDPVDCGTVEATPAD